MGLSGLEYWQKAVSDADAADWITVFAYGIAAVTAYQASAAARDAANPAGERRFWAMTSLSLILLGANELLDLQALLTGLGKAHAQANGWYESRRMVQYIFVAGLAVGALVATTAIIWFTRAMTGTIRIALLGLAFIGAFIVLRAASLHHTDDLLGSGWQAFNLGAIQEMTGIAMIGGAAWIYTRASTEGGDSN